LRPGPACGPRRSPGLGLASVRGLSTDSSGGVALPGAASAVTAAKDMSRSAISLVSPRFSRRFGGVRRPCSGCPLGAAGRGFDRVRVILITSGRRRPRPSRPSRAAQARGTPSGPSRADARETPSRPPAMPTCHAGILLAPTDRHSQRAVRTRSPGRGAGARCPGARCGRGAVGLPGRVAVVRERPQLAAGAAGPDARPAEGRPVHDPSRRQLELSRCTGTTRANHGCAVGPDQLSGPPASGSRPPMTWANVEFTRPVPQSAPPAGGGGRGRPELRCGSCGAASAPGRAGIGTAEIIFRAGFELRPRREPALDLHSPQGRLAGAATADAPERRQRPRSI
jgi:hypothetical protein